MALHYELEIHRTAYDLLGEAVEAVRQMPRDLKPMLGRTITDGCLALDLDIRAANIAADKVPHLDRLLAHLSTIETCVRLCRDREYLTRRAYTNLITRTQQIGRQANGWKKQQLQHRSSELRRQNSEPHEGADRALF